MAKVDAPVTPKRGVRMQRAAVGWGWAATVVVESMMNALVLRGGGLSASRRICVGKASDLWAQFARLSRRAAQKSLIC